MLDGNDSIDVATLTTALADSSRDVRMNAVRIAERWLADVNHPVYGAVLELIDDPDWNVRQQLAASLGAMAAEPKATALASLLQKHANDPVVMDAALSGLGRHRNDGARETASGERVAIVKPPQPRSR